MTPTGQSNRHLKKLLKLLFLALKHTNIVPEKTLLATCFFCMKLFNLSSINKNIEEKKKSQEEYARAIKPFMGRKKCHEGPCSFCENIAEKPVKKIQI